MLGGAYNTAEVRTVAVPTFGNETFRRGIEYQLTEAIQNEIQNRTPFRIAKEPNADTRLSGRIVQVGKRSLNQSRFRDVREVELTLAVEVTWEDIRTGKTLAQEQIPLNPASVKLLTNTGFAPEVGHSLATAKQRATQQMARQIVDMMETPW
ncbi:hypothetical protein-transmembrane region and signal peptide prediction [hydrothermal vent metagenome]|uniref:Lipoprotein n=1 Tax=hydrothermal vent metagenome TaxID=652676 RepID=A0A3B1DVR5_9ZZZZ